MDIKALVLRCTVTWHYHTTIFNTLLFMEERISWWKHDGWRAKHRKHDGNTEKAGERGAHAGGALPLEFAGAGGSAYCTSSSSKAYFRGRPRCMWRPRLNSSSSTVQKDPNSSSTLTKHLCRERLVRMAPWESKPARTARCRCSDGQDRGRTHRQTRGGGVGGRGWRPKWK